MLLHLSYGPHSSLALNPCGTPEINGITLKPVKVGESGPWDIKALNELKERIIRKIIEIKTKLERKDLKDKVKLREEALLKGVVR